MTQKELQKLSESLREDGVVHLLLAKMRGGITFSSFAYAEDIYDFLHAMIDTNPAVLEIMKEVIESRKKAVKPTITYLN